MRVRSTASLNAAPSQGMAHVPRVAEHDRARHAGRQALHARRQEGVGHRAQPVRFQRVLDARLQRGREVWDKVV